MSVFRGMSLYRMFDQDGRLLYIGVTALPGSRIEQHRLSKPWWPMVHRITLEHFDERTVAFAAEREAIKNERPLYNKVRDEAAAS